MDNYSARSLQLLAIAAGVIPNVDNLDLSRMTWHHHESSQTSQKQDCAGDGRLQSQKLLAAGSCFRGHSQHKQAGPVMHYPAPS